MWFFYEKMLIKLVFQKKVCILILLKRKFVFGTVFVI